MTAATPRNRDISIDIETLGTRFDAPVIAIGAVVFDRLTGNTGAEFYQEIDLDSAIRAGRVDGSTLSWWMTQSATARGVFPVKKDKGSLATVLCNFADFCRSISGGVPIVWGNGATFDITILEHAFAVGSVGLSAPWHYTNVRDMRTLVDVSGLALGAVPSVGVAHNALDDAKYQAHYIAAALMKVAKALALADGGSVAPAKPAKAVKAVPAAAAAPAGKRYWYHPESEAYFTTEPGDCPSDCADGRPCDELSQAVYEEATEL